MYASGERFWENDEVDPITVSDVKHESRLILEVPFRDGVQVVEVFLVKVVIRAWFLGQVAVVDDPWSELGGSSSHYCSLFFILKVKVI